ncbi:hypothetical protein MANY_53740 [Mycolicibacterium anyangense]|uniref:Uncharacterized protein n=1 Tax=Mycolicibacterium anyangense TaxID=1431246 RepID=A0A6N4WIH9_9MYCO|nr:hypothetical protein [Mycolicibacterium anyangense]BBZ80037.1 hypothetical protein MANY_53740 [Mycolicibacterium anyangense]
MASKASVRPVVRAHFDTLRDDRSGEIRMLDLVLFAGVPVVAGLALGIFEFRMKDTAAVLAGLAVFTALLFGLVIFVFQLRVQIKDDGRDRDRPRLASLIDETFANVTYSVVIGIVTTVVGVVAAAMADKDAGAPIWISAVLAALGLHLVLTILMCLKRVHSAYQQLRA